MIKSKLPEYRIWIAMKSRCNNPSTASYERYGGRGIRVSSKWDTFEAFYEDMGPRPSKKYSIERINNDGDYEPGNCRWATESEQKRNTSQTHLITFNKRTQCMADWAKELGIAPHTLYNRLQKWPLEIAMTIKGRSTTRRRANLRNITYKGKTQCLRRWSEEYEINYCTLQARLNKGWPVEKAFTTPVK